MNALLTDLYQLTMAAGYFEAGKTTQRATFELSVRRLPANRNFLIAAGLEQAVDYLLNLSFTREEIDYVRGLSQFSQVPTEFFEALAISVSPATCLRFAKARRCSRASRC